MGCGGSKTSDDKPMVIFVLGGPGSGKGTQCANIVKKHAFTHLSTGDLLREEVEKKGPNAEVISQLQKDGKLVNSEILVKIIESRLSSGKGKRFLLDGFPRNEENDEVWGKIIGSKASTPFLLYFHCSAETMKARILGRAKTSGRSDDNEEAIVKRLNVYESQTIPMIEKYRKQSKVCQIDCEKGPDDVFMEVEKVLKEKKVV